jgi:hypothetical protein
VNNKQTGSYYTPKFIAQYIVNRTLYVWLKGFIDYDYDKIKLLDEQIRKTLLDRVKGLRILDPAVGEGVFLCAAADRLLKLREMLGDSESTGSIREDIVRSLYGVDILKEAVAKCRINLRNWMGFSESSSVILNNIKLGNSLIGLCKDDCRPDGYYGKFKQILDLSGLEITDEELRKINPFHWGDNFPQVMSGEGGGFDIVVGNPPYGNILSATEREIISKIYPYCVGGNRSGTWNSAAHFIVRAKMFLRKGGQLGFLLPNSLLRVGQFTKTREFLLNEMTLHEIVDEGSPFPNVTLEMVSLICSSEPNSSDHDVKIRTRRDDVPENHAVPWSVFNDSKIFVLYYDDTYARILERSERDLLTAGRGRDIPAELVSDLEQDVFEIPYAATGRSVQRYRFDYEHMKYTNTWYESDTALSESFSNEFLVATKNLPYPRCVMKPVGMLHGGGVVRIEPLRDDVDLATIGLILNSNLMKYICIRYLTNYSELTTCMNTGIMEDMPIILPENTKNFARLFRALEKIHSERKGDSQTQEMELFLEDVSNSLVYSLYILDNYDFINLVNRALETCQSNHYVGLYKSLHRYPEILENVKKVMQNPLVASIENSPRMS